MAEKKPEAEKREIHFVARHGNSERGWGDMIDRARVERGEGWFARWLDSRGIDPRALSDEDLCRKVIEFFNATRRLPGEEARTFVRLGEVT